MPTNITFVPSPKNNITAVYRGTQLLYWTRKPWDYGVTLDLLRLVPDTVTLHTQTVNLPDAGPPQTIQEVADLGRVEVTRVERRRRIQEAIAAAQLELRQLGE